MKPPTGSAPGPEGDGQPERLGFLRTSIDGGDPDASIDKLMSVSRFFRLEAERARESLAAVVAATLRWRELAHAHGLTRETLREMEPAFEHEQLEKSRSLTGI